MIDAVYPEFQRTFRGSSLEISARLHGYYAFLVSLSTSSQLKSLDLACGRGEWLDLLAQLDISAIGVDKNNEMITLCQAKGHQAHCIDIFEYLKGCDDNSFSLVSAFHLIEHLQLDQLQILIQECLRVLHPKGILLLETPSIDNLLVSSKGFYADPTHNLHIHPETLAFLMRSSGFNWTHIAYINPGPEHSSTQRYLQRILNGVAQDVAIFACPSLNSIQVQLSDDWTSSLNRGQTTLDAVHQCGDELDSRLVDIENQLSLLQYSNSRRLSNLVKMYIPVSTLKRVSNTTTLAIDKARKLVTRLSCLILHLIAYTTSILIPLRSIMIRLGVYAPLFRILKICQSLQRRKNQTMPSLTANKASLKRRSLSIHSHLIARLTGPKTQ